VNLRPIISEPPKLLTFAKVTDMSIRNVPVEVPNINAMHLCDLGARKDVILGVCLVPTFSVQIVGVAQSCQR